jgi:hypothetical protein
VVAADGTCLFDGLLPGRYDLALQFRRPVGVSDGSGIAFLLGSVVVRAGEVTDFAGDLTELAPCRLRGQVFVNGEPWVGHSAFLVRRFGIGKVYTDIVTDGDGRFEVDTVPGRNELQVLNVGTETIDVGPGQVTSAVFSLRCVAVHVRILDADGKPAAGLRVTMDTQAESWDWQSWTTDANGCIDLDRAPMKSFTFIVHPPGATDSPSTAVLRGLAARLPGASRVARLGPFCIPASGNTVTFEDRLPEDWR